ncbi:hypothetical protein [Vibrio rhizosphaerae]|uniref:hypothetical protein n=1 Tax=Vibrio rhizosphaerae TaxID=398736 RepID=UPI00056EB1C2|nr:hypothetical protein [Vibrio rhizosphaerae]
MTILGLDVSSATVTIGSIILGVPCVFFAIFGGIQFKLYLYLNDYISEKSSTAIGLFLLISLVLIAVLGGANDYTVYLGIPILLLTFFFIPAPVLLVISIPCIFLVLFIAQPGAVALLYLIGFCISVVPATKIVVAVFKVKTDK